MQNTLICSSDSVQAAKMDSEHGFGKGKKNVLWILDRIEGCFIDRVVSILAVGGAKKRNGYSSYTRVILGHYTVRVRSAAAPQ